ncbi:MAG: hypothetical protein GY866_08745 [Proteobacteria bacterium]|nr:hypothetical protein [Pseudomonadota bacterium]
MGRNALNDDPAKKALIQMQGVFSELEKSWVVRKLVRPRRETAAKNKKLDYLTLKGEGKCAGQKSYRETNPELVKLAKKLY